MVISLSQPFSLSSDKCDNGGGLGGLDGLVSGPGLHFGPPYFRGY